jgi:hypothetical protein
LRGGVHRYAAQANPKIDAAWTEKNPFLTETKYDLNYGTYFLGPYPAGKNPSKFSELSYTCPMAVTITCYYQKVLVQSVHHNVMPSMDCYPPHGAKGLPTALGSRISWPGHPVTTILISSLQPRGNGSVIWPPEGRAERCAAWSATSAKKRPSPSYPDLKSWNTGGIVDMMVDADLKQAEREKRADE